MCHAGDCFQATLDDATGHRNRLRQGLDRGLEIIEKLRQKVADL
jgi:hypothetical protein